MDAWKVDSWRLRRRSPPASAAAGADGIQLLALADSVVRVQVLGTGTSTVVLCVDPPNVIEHYRAIVDALTPSARVICFELPGSGYSRPKESYRFTLDDQVKAVTELLDLFGVRRATFGFPCLTAFVGIAVANKRPDFVERFVIAQGAGYHEAVKWTHRIDELGLLRLPFVGQLANWAARKTLVRRFYRSTVSPDDEEPAAHITTALQALTKGADCCLATDFQRLRSVDGRKISGLNLPATIVWGEGDPTHKKTDRHSMRNHLPKANLVHFWGMSHFPDLDDPLRFAQLLMGIAEQADDGPTTEQTAPAPQMSALEAELFADDSPPAAPIPAAEPLPMDTVVSPPAAFDDAATTVGGPALAPAPPPTPAVVSSPAPMWAPLPPKVPAAAASAEPFLSAEPEPAGIAAAPDPRLDPRTVISAPFIGEPDPEETQTAPSDLPIPTRPSLPAPTVPSMPAPTVVSAPVEPPWLRAVSAPAPASPPPLPAPAPVPVPVPVRAKPVPVARIEPVRTPAKSESLELDLPLSHPQRRAAVATPARPVSGAKAPAKKKKAKRATNGVVSALLRLGVSAVITAGILGVLGANLVAGIDPQDIAAALPSLAQDPRVLAFVGTALLTPLFDLFLHACDFLFPGERGLAALAGGALAGIFFAALCTALATAAAFPLQQLGTMPGPLSESLTKIDWDAALTSTRAALPGLVPAWRAIATAGIVLGAVNAISGPRR